MECAVCALKHLLIFPAYHVPSLLLDCIAVHIVRSLRCGHIADIMDQPLWWMPCGFMLPLL